MGTRETKLQGADTAAPTPDYYDVNGVEILRTGEFTAMDGKAFSATPAILEEIQASYDPDYHEAKVNFDHVNSGPASSGRVKALRVEGNRLVADLTGLPWYLAHELTKDGSWPSRSAELYPDLDGRGMYLRNVSLLGVKPPAVKGLKPVRPSQIVPVFDGQPGMSYALAETDGEREVIVLSEQMSDLEVESMTPKPKDESGSDGATNLAGGEDSIQLAELKKNNSLLLASLTQERLLRRRGAAETAVAKMEAAGTVTPAMREAGLVDLLTFAAGDEQEVLCFSEDGELSEKKPLKDMLMALLAALPANKPKSGATKLGEKPDLTAPEAALTEEDKTIANAMGVDLAELAKTKAHLLGEGS